MAAAPRPDRRSAAPAVLSRRSVLLGGAGLGLLAACGGGKDSATTTEPVGGDPTGSSLVTFFDGASSLVPGRPQRATFGLGDQNGNLVKDVPAFLEFEVLDDNERPLGRPITVKSHDAGLPRAYFPLIFTPTRSGTHAVRTVVEGTTISAAFDIGKPAEVTVPAVGEAVPVLDSPTTTDARGVEPICTQEPACPLHDVNLRDALATKKRIALLVSTPAYCQTAICGPILDVVLSQRGAYVDQMVFIHVEVFKSAAEVDEQGASAQLAPVVEALKLTFEPCLFLVNPEGKVQNRLDVIFDEVELKRELEKFVS